MPANRATLFTRKPTLRLIPGHGIMPACSYLEDYAAAATGKWDGIRHGAVKSEDWHMPTSQAAYEEAFVTQ
jgi:hypothetical protein